MSSRVWQSKGYLAQAETVPENIIQSLPPSNQKALSSQMLRETIQQPNAPPHTSFHKLISVAIIKHEREKTSVNPGESRC